MRNFSLLGYISYKRLLFITRYRPLDINIETISWCPLKCQFCCNRLYDRERTVMNNKMFEKIIRQYCKVLGGGTLGINSMHSEFFSDPLLMERIKILKKYKKQLYIYTDTPLITCAKYTDEELKEILETLDCMEISVEGHSAESYKVLSGVDGFRTLQQQLERIKGLVDRYQLNIKIRLLCRTYQKGSFLHSSFYKECQKKFEIAEVRDYFFSWFGSVKAKDLPKGAHLLKVDDTKKKRGCVAAYATLSVEADGKVAGCGCVDWLGKYVIGDVNFQSLDEIWRSRKAKSFRYALDHKKCPSICRGCGLYESVSDSFCNKKLLSYHSHKGLYYRIK